MTQTIANVDQASDSFGGWISKTNQVAHAMSNFVVSTSNATHSNRATGNAAITNAFTANIAFVNSISGGSTTGSGGLVSTAANLAISSNLYIVPYAGGNVVVIVGNSTTGAFSTTITGNSIVLSPTNTTISGTLLTVNTSIANLTVSNTTLTGNVHVYGNSTIKNIELTGNTTTTNLNIVTSTTKVTSITSVFGNTIIGANTTRDNIKVTGNTTYSNVVVAANDIYLSPSSNVEITSTLYISNVVNAGNTTITGFASIGSNSTVNTVITATSITQSNTIATPLVANSLGMFHTGTINAASLTTSLTTVNNTGVYVGANVFANASTLFVGNSTINTTINAISFSQSNGTATNLMSNATGIYHTGVVNAVSFTSQSFTSNNSGVFPASNTVGTAFGNTTARWNITSNTIAASGATTLNSTLAAGNTTVTGFANISSSLQVTGNTVLNGNVALGNSSVAVALIANGSTGASQQFLLSNGSAAYWETITNVNVVNNLIAYTFTNTVIFDTSANNQQNNPLVVKSQNTASITIQGDSAATANGLNSGAFLRLGTEGTANMGFFAIVQEAGNNGIGGAYTGSLANSVLIGTVANSTLLPSLQFGTANAVVQTITSGGNTGFGNTAPANKVRVEGTLSALTSIAIANGTTSILTANSTGVFPASNTVGNAFGNTTARWIITADTLSTTGAVDIDDTLAVGNTSVTGFVNATSSVNSAVISAGADVSLNATAFFVQSNSTHNTIITSNTFTTPALTANGSGIFHTGTINAASFKTTGININATSIVPTSNTSGSIFGNTLSRWIITANSLTASANVVASNFQYSNGATVGVIIYNAAGTQVFP